ncbi:MAG: EAL domain-containing protein [Gammaproteobacteria bacterium]|nr:EAL domain-containing protein [Gammaproteobacteria bacterium]
MQQLLQENKVLRQRVAELEQQREPPSDSTSLSHLEQAFHTLVKGMAGWTGQAYFDQIVCRLCDWFGADGVCICLFTKEGKVRGVSEVRNGRMVQESEDRIPGSLWKNIVEQGIFRYPEVADRPFADDPQLAQLGVKGLVGIAIKNMDHEMLGVIKIVSARPLHPPTHWQSILEVVVDRTAAELERLRAGRTLRERTALLDGILKSSTSVAIAATDMNLRITYYNPAAEKMFGYKAVEVIGKTVPELHVRVGMDSSRLRQVIEIVKAKGEYQYGVEQRKNGEKNYTECHIFLIVDTQGESVGFTLMAEDVSERRRAMELIVHQARFDALTELPNRRTMMERLVQALSRCRRHGHLGALVYLDLDHFKSINDSLGHAVGDGLLQSIAQCLQRASRREDTVSRVGGDEFVILFSELSDKLEAASQQAQVGVDSIRKLLSSTLHSIQGNELSTTASFGIALFPTGDETAGDILRRADTAMSRAKGMGRNELCFFLPDMQRAAERRLKLQNDLFHVLNREELHLLYQPQVDVGGRIVGMEALLRWRHPTRGLLLPHDFIPVAEDTGIIVAIGEWVLETVVSSVRELVKNSISRIAVNVSPCQFFQEDFTKGVEHLVIEADVDPSLLMLEITEGIMVHNLDDVVQKMNHLKRLGVRFSMDDFGTGYSSLSHLRHLPLDEVKIDHSFVHDIGVSLSNERLVETIISMAVHLGLDLVAEGVETAGQFDFLAGRGCKLFQGNYFSKPVTLDSIVEPLL